MRQRGRKAAGHQCGGSGWVVGCIKLGDGGYRLLRPLKYINLACGGGGVDMPAVEGKVGVGGCVRGEGRQLCMHVMVPVK